MTARRALVALAAAVAAAGCRPYEVPTFAGDLVLGGVRIPAATLDAGARAYMRQCRPCHGERGDGRGPQAVGQDPPPRDFRLGLLQFGSVPSGSLWRDEDVTRIVRGGVGGTAMLAWRDVSDADLTAIAQFLKTFSPRWRDEVPEEPVAVTPDPWTGRDGAAIARGRAVYHGLARCQACHPAYAPRGEIDALARALGAPEVEARPGALEPLECASDFGRKLRATDFPAGPLRAARGGTRLEDLARTIAAGVGGTAMPTWKGALPDPDLWALARYVDHLARLGPAGGAALRRDLGRADAGAPTALP